jgi:hypothetical protein
MSKNLNKVIKNIPYNKLFFKLYFKLIYIIYIIIIITIDSIGFQKKNPIVETTGLKPKLKNKLSFCTFVLY